MTGPGQPTPREAARIRMTTYRAGRVEVRDDRLAGEEPMAIRACGPGQVPVDVAVTMRTPGHEAELAVGFLRTEGLLGDVASVVRITTGDPAGHAQPDDEQTVHLAHAFDAGRVAERHFVATASCGICGKASLDEVEVRCAPIPDGPIIDPATLLALPPALREAQSVFEATGGLHAAGLFEPDGVLVAMREDVGRHNALDKLIGSQLLAGTPSLDGRDRPGVGTAQLRARAEGRGRRRPDPCGGLGAHGSRGRGRRAARRETLVGFLRGDAFNVYARPDRVSVGRA